jgi:hypothetical protein
MRARLAAPKALDCGSLLPLCGSRSLLRGAGRRQAFGSPNTTL